MVRKEFLWIEKSELSSNHFRWNTLRTSEMGFRVLTRELWVKMFDHHRRNTSSNETLDNFFDAVYEKNFYLVFANVLSVANILFLTPLYYGVIWFEKYGSNHRRSLVNQVKYVWAVGSVPPYHALFIHAEVVTFEAF